MDRTIGLLGGGQLGQMLCEAANPLGINVIILDAERSPAKQVNAKHLHVNGSFADADKIRQLARQVDILTVEIEHVDTYVLEEIAERGVEVVDSDGRKSVRKVEVQPSWKTLRVIQDKYLQKEHLAQYNVATAVSRAVGTNDLEAFGKEHGFPFMLKARKDAYDGRGNFPVHSSNEIPEALEALKGRSLYAEKWAEFKMELAVMVVKTEDGSKPGDISTTIAYPAVETIHEDSICKLVYAPPRGVSKKLQQEAQTLARRAVSCLWGKGVFGVELFLMADDTILVNEIAPRPHNSGHYTIEGCPTLSQYKAQIYSILGLMSTHEETIPLELPSAVMLNILGGADKDSHLELVKSAVSLGRKAALHMYGKESKPARKIGHVTITGSSSAETEEIVKPLIAIADSMRAARKQPKAASRTVSKEISKATQPLVAVTMGSDSDLNCLKPGLQILKDFNIPYMVTITSAHRTPQRMTEFAQEAASKGIKVIIGAAGGAAHLPGMLAASTPLPVIGVPVKGSTLDGMDSLLSIVQMPRGVPVASVAINNSTNAALLAIRILGSSDDKIRLQMERYMKDMETSVEEKAEKLETKGWEAY